MVVDCTAFGDVSRLLLGGRQQHVKEAVAAQHAEGRSTAHLLGSLLAPGDPPAAAPATPGRAGASAALSGAPGGAASWAASALDFNIAQRYGVPVSEVRGGLGACGHAARPPPTPAALLGPWARAGCAEACCCTAIEGGSCARNKCASVGLHAGQPRHPNAQPAAHPQWGHQAAALLRRGWPRHPVRLPCFALVSAEPVAGFDCVLGCATKCTGAKRAACQHCNLLPAACPVAQAAGAWPARPPGRAARRLAGARLPWVVGGCLMSRAASMPGPT